MPRFPNYLDNTLVVNPAAAVVDTIEASTIGDVVKQTTLKLTQTPLLLTAASTGVGWGGVLLATFPAGRIKVHGVTVAGVTWTSIDGGLDSADGGDFAMGSTSEEDGTMDRATDVDLCPKTSIDPIATAANAALATSAQFDGTSTATAIYFNGLIDAGDITDATDETVGVNGTIVITWSNLGDY